MDAVELQAAYVRERAGAESLIEPGKGFATWKLLSPDDCYIIDIYVAPDYRQNGVAASLADRIAASAKATGAKRLLGTVDPRANGCTDSAKALLAYGFELSHIDGSLIWFAKGIG